MQTRTPPKLNTARLVDGALFAIVVALLGFAAFAYMQPSPLSQTVGAPAPAFKLKTQSGEVTGPPDYPDKVVLLDFWATWCEPCFRQMPALQMIEEEMGDDLVVLAVNVDDPAEERTEAMEKFLEDAQVETDSLIDDGSVATMYGVDSIPALVLIDSAGVVRWASSGVHTVDEIREQVEYVMEAGR